MLDYANKMQKVAIKSLTCSCIYCNCFINNAPKKKNNL